MQKKLLKLGKIIFPNNLKINKKFNIGIIGSGKMAQNYIEIIKSFNHNISVIVSLSKNQNAKKIAKKYRSELYHDYKDIKNTKIKIDAWIICSKWNNLDKSLRKLIGLNKPLLVEKSITMSSKNLSKFFNKNIKNSSKVFFAYNRNYYDYIFQLTNQLRNNNSLRYIDAKFYDPYSKIIKAKGNSIKKYLPYYITSHWIVLILKIFNLLDIKIINVEKKKIFSSNKLSSVVLIFKLKFNKEIIFFRMANMPDEPKNHIIEFYLKRGHIQISPIEKMSFIKNIEIKKKISQNIYVPNVKNVKVDNKYKPGLRALYYSFIKENFFNEKSVLKTSKNDLIKAYKLCELLN